MKLARFDLGSTYIDLTKTRLVIGGRWRRAPHLTIFFEPNPDSGRWTPHLTFEGATARKTRHTLGKVSQDAMTRFVEGVGRDLLHLRYRASRPVRVEDLDEAGWLVHAPSERVVADLGEQAFSIGERRFALTAERFERMKAALNARFEDDCIRPLDLLDGYNLDRPYLALRVKDDERVVMAWLSRRLGPRDDRGDWELTRFDWLRPATLDPILFKRAAGLKTALSKIARALRLKDPFVGSAA